MRWSNAGSPLPLVGLRQWIGSTGNQSQSSLKQVPERKFGSKRHVVSDEASLPNEGIVLIGLYERILRHSFRTPADLSRLCVDLPQRAALFTSVQSIATMNRLRGCRRTSRRFGRNIVNWITPIIPSGRDVRGRRALWESPSRLPRHLTPAR
jgi:hypothetical protein